MLISNMGVGMGMIAGIGGSLGNAVGGMMSNTVNQAMGQQPNAPASPTAELKCAKCGAVLQPNAKFCLECGEKVTAPLAENEMICPKCGAKVAKGKFCLECGAPL